MNAYDYNTQTWVTNERHTRKLLRAQLTEALAILLGRNGADFHAFTRKRGDTTTLAQAISAVRAQLAALEG